MPVAARDGCRICSSVWPNLWQWPLEVDYASGRDPVQKMAEGRLSRNSKSTIQLFWSEHGLDVSTCQCQRLCYGTKSRTRRCMPQQSGRCAGAMPERCPEPPLIPPHPTTFWSDVKAPLSPPLSNLLAVKKRWVKWSGRDERHDRGGREGMGAAPKPSLVG